MELVDSNLISRGMIKVQAGEDLVEALHILATAAGWRDAFVSGAGVLELVELTTAEGGTETYENAELTSLAGRITRSADGGVEVALRGVMMVRGAMRSGRIAAAMTGGLLLVVDAVAEEPAHASVPPRTERSQPGAVSPQPSAVSPQPSAVSPQPSAGAASPSPGQVAPAAPAGAGAPRSATKPLSQSFTTKPVVRPVAAPSVDLEDDGDEIPIVNPGDLLNHPQLGLCEVVGDDDSGGTKIRVPSGRMRVLRLDALRVQRREIDDQGRKVFKILGPRKRW